jgi:hypothetical protein
MTDCALSNPALRRELRSRKPGRLDLLTTMSAGTVETNWSGNYAYRARVIHHPAGVDELCTLLAGTDRAHVLGSRHSFTAIADAPELIALDRMPGDIAIDRASSTVSLPAHVTYAELAEALNREGVALPSMASLPHISVAGAIATGTHGSGDAQGNLATAVTALELVTPEGRPMTTQRGDPDFDGLVVGLGALGAVTRVTLAVEPYYEMRQRLFTGLSWEALADHYDAITGAGESVSVFHLFGEQTEQLWIKRRVNADGSDDGSADPGAMFGATPATTATHPVLRSTARHSSGRWDRGRSVSRTSGRASPRARARRSNPSSSSHVRTRSLRCGSAGARAGHPAAAPDLRAAHDRRRHPVAQPPVRSADVGDPFHLAPPSGRSGASRGPNRGGPRSLRSPAALGQAVQSPRGHARASLPSDGGLPAPPGAAGSAGRLRQRLAARPGAGRSLGVFGSGLAY